MMPCEDVSKLIFDMYFLKRASIKGHFGVILGPSGSGKTIVAMDLCERYPKGVLYMEVVEVAVFAEQLAKCIGIRLGPSNLEDLALGCISDEYRYHYNLPAELSKGVNTVMRIQYCINLYVRKVTFLLKSIISLMLIFSVVYQMSLFSFLLCHCRYSMRHG